MPNVPQYGQDPLDPEIGLDRAREKIAREEQYADDMNLLRERRRANGGGPLRHALHRIRRAFDGERTP